MNLKLGRKLGFTLVEILVVISIIVVLAAMSLPALSDFMRLRRLKGAASLIQMVCMEARNRAIAQKERQYIVFFRRQSQVTINEIASATEQTKTGAARTIYNYDSNESSSNRIDQVGGGLELPELIDYERPNNVDNFRFTCYPDGTIILYGIADLANDPEGSTDTDIIFQQTGFHLKCYVDIIGNTGRVRFAIK